MGYSIRLDIAKKFGNEIVMFDSFECFAKLISIGYTYLNLHDSISVKGLFPEGLRQIKNEI